MEAINPAFAEVVERSFAQQSAMQTIGARLARIAPGQVEITLPYRPDLTQQHGYLHAGIVTAIADTACGYAAYSLMPAGASVLSVEFKVNLLRPAVGKEFSARAQVIKPGRTLTVVSADVYSLDDNAHEELIATMLATMFCIMKS